MGLRRAAAGRFTDRPSPALLPVPTPLPSGRRATAHWRCLYTFARCAIDLRSTARRFWPVALLAALTFPGRGPAAVEGASSLLETRPDIVFTRIQSTAGLSPIVRDVVQTADGYLWLATEAGLSRFDGVRHKIHRATSTPELKHSIIRVLCEDPAGGALWVGTDHGLARWEAGCFTAIDLPDTAVSSLARDTSGTIWIGTETRGLFEYRDGQLVDHGANPVMPARNIRQLFADSSGRVWISFARRAGVVVFQDGKFEPFPAPELAQLTVLSMAETEGRTIWFGTETGGILQLRDGSIRQFGRDHGLGSEQVFDLLADRSGRLWAICRGLFQWDGADSLARLPLLGHGDNTTP